MGVNRFNPGIDQLSHLLLAQNTDPRFLLGGLVGSYLKDRFHDAMSGFFAHGDGGNKDGGANGGGIAGAMANPDNMKNFDPSSVMIAPQQAQPQQQQQPMPSLQPQPDTNNNNDNNNGMSFSNLLSGGGNTNQGPTINTQGDVVTAQAPSQRESTPNNMILPDMKKAGNIANGLAQLGQQQAQNAAMSGGAIDQLRAQTMQAGAQAAQVMAQQQAQEEQQNKQMMMNLAKMYFTGGFNGAPDKNSVLPGALNNNNANTINEALQRVQGEIMANKANAKTPQDAAKADNSLKVLQGIANAYGVPFIGEDGTSQNNLSKDDVALKAMEILKANKQIYNKASKLAESGSDELKAQAKQLQDNSHTQAELTRKLMQEMGVNSKAFSQDADVNQLSIAIRNKAEAKAKAEQTKAREEVAHLSSKDLLEQPRLDINPNEFYSKSYNELRKKGYPEWIARQRASASADEYQAKYETQGINAMATQGINPDGSINDNGMAILSKLANAGSTAAAQILNSGYATPLRQWGFTKDVEKSNINLAHNKELQHDRLANNMQLAQYKGEVARALEQQKFNDRLRMMQLARAMARPRVVYAGGGGGGGGSHRTAVAHTALPAQQQAYVNLNKQLNTGAGAPAQGAGMLAKSVAQPQQNLSQAQINSILNAKPTTFNQLVGAGAPANDNPYQGILTKGAQPVNPYKGVIANAVEQGGGAVPANIVVNNQPVAIPAPPSIPTASAATRPQAINNTTDLPDDFLKALGAGYVDNPYQGVLSYGLSSRPDPYEGLLSQGKSVEAGLDWDKINNTHYRGKKKDWSAPPKWSDKAIDLYKKADEAVGTEDGAEAIGDLYEFVNDAREKHELNPNYMEALNHLQRQAYALTYKHAVTVGVDNAAQEGKKDGAMGSSYAEEAYNALKAVPDDEVEELLKMSKRQKDQELVRLRAMF